MSMDTVSLSHTHKHKYTQTPKIFVIYCPKLVHKQSARQALCNKSITVHRGMEKSSQPLIHAPSHHLTLFIAVQMHSVYLPQYRGPI